MKEKTISVLVMTSVLLVALIGLYIAFSSSNSYEGKSTEGARLYFEAHRPYMAGGMRDLFAALEERPLQELPAGEYWEGFCALMLNKRSTSVIPVPVPRHAAYDIDDSDSITRMERRGYMLLKVMPSSSEYICPPSSQLPTLAEILEEMRA